MQYCTTPGCPGHPGKFTDCGAEALYSLSLDGVSQQTGDVEFNGHFTLIMLDQSTPVTLVDGGERTVSIAPGNYLVAEDSNGFVSVREFGSGARDRVTAMETFQQLENEHSAWLSQDDDDTDFDHVAERRGWDNDRQLEVVRAFIAEQGRNAELGEFAAELGD